ncbi:MAG TPA: lysylphosphatidylglycerol synthase domain-containing protein [Candidatus Binataceae bacterium]|nr:lysylphosphatidylglycerol synthase domain-containing protein [Candidatus Binataceae bacterium]
MKRLETLIIVLALAFYIWFLRRFGLAQVLGYVRLVGWGLMLTISLETVSRLFNTLGWRVTIRDCPRELSFLELFAARISGEAVDYVTPSAQLGGQPVMAMMVRRKLPMARGLASVAVAALAESIGQILFISAALLAALPLVWHLHDLFWPVLGGFAVAVGLAYGFYLLQVKQPFALLWRAADKLDLPMMRGDDVRRSADEADALLLDFYAHRRMRLAASCICYFFAWAMGPVEIYILLHLLYEPATVQVALLVEALGLLIERATFMIPAKLVSQEGGKALILAMLGYSADVGFAIGFLRRIKEMAWVMFGLGTLAAHRLITDRAERLLQTEGAFQGAEGD